MTTKQLLPPGSDKDFAVVHSTLTDSKVTAELLAATDRSGSKYRIPLLGEARRIGHTLNTLDRIKARHDALVAACEAMRDSGMFDWEGAIAYKEEAALVMAALEQVK